MSNVNYQITYVGMVHITYSNSSNHTIHLAIQSKLSTSFSQTWFPFIVIFYFLDDGCHDTNLIYVSTFCK
jgi:hypothetical protein